MSRVSMVLIAVLVSWTTAGAVPMMMNFQGRVEVADSPYSGYGAFKFALVDNPDSPTVSYWSNDSTSISGSEPGAAVAVAVQEGLYNILLGETGGMDPFDGSEFTGNEVYLRIWFDDGINGFQLMSPDQRMTAQGFALRAATADDADTVDGMEGADLEESAEIDTDIASHAGNTIAHHAKTTSFMELTDTATDAQVPNDITLALSSIQNAASNDFHNIGGTDAVDDTDADATNELQTLGDVLNQGNDAGRQGMENLGSVCIGNSGVSAGLDITGDLHISGTMTQGEFQEYADTEQLETGNFDNTPEMWQSFTMESTGYLSKIGVNTAAISGGVMRIYSGEGTGGYLLNEQNVSLTGGETMLILASDVFVEAGSKYTMVLSFGGSWLWFGKVGNPYPGGRASYSDTFDQIFHTYVRRADEVVTEEGDIHCASNLRFTIADDGAGSDHAMVSLDAGSGKKLSFYNHDNSQYLMTLEGDTGYVGIGIDTPGFMLHVNGTAGKPGGGSWADASDARLKENIRHLDGQVALDKIREFQGVTYNWINPEEHTDGEVAGITAQNLKTVFPDWVEEVKPVGADADLIPEGEKAKAIHFPHDFNAYLIEAIKELDSQNDELRKLIKLQDKRIEQLEEQITVK